MTSKMGKFFQRLSFRKRHSRQPKPIRIREWFDYTATEENIEPAIRDLTSWLVERHFPKESNIVDTIMADLLDENGPRPMLAADAPKIVGLGYYGNIGDLGSVKAFLFAAMLMLEVASAASASTKTIAETIREFPRDQDAYGSLLIRAQEDLGLDAKSAQKFIDTTLDVIDPHFRFVLGRAVPMEENRYCEFKMHHSSNNVRAIGNDAYKYIAGFLNRSGGRIYFGITDERRTVEGIALSSKERDEVRQYIVMKTKSMKPPVYSERYRINFHQVFDEQGSEVPDLFVVEIIVPFSPDLPVIHTRGGREFVKTESGVDKDRH